LFHKRCAVCSCCGHIEINDKYGSRHKHGISMEQASPHVWPVATVLQVMRCSAPPPGFAPSRATHRGHSNGHGIDASHRLKSSRLKYYVFRWASSIQFARCYFSHVDRHITICRLSFTALSNTVQRHNILTLFVDNFDFR